MEESVPGNKQMKSRIIKIGKKAFILVLFLIAYLLFHWSADYPQQTEQYYSGGFFVYTNRVLVGLSSLLPVSLAEIMVLLLSLYILFVIGRTVYRAVTREKALSGRMLCILETVMHLLVLTGIIVFLYVVFWGLNNNRQSLAESIGITVEKSAVSELAACCMSLLELTNTQREKMLEDNEGVMRLSDGRQEVMNRAGGGYQDLALELPTLAKIKPGTPKPVLSSVLMSYAGITGIYFPFTAEANINVHILDMELPFTVCHELAHQMGYAGEDEANFIAWLACSQSPCLDYQYSGNYYALTYLMNALAAADREVWREVYTSCSPGLQRDFAAASRYWDQFKGPIKEVSTVVNDSFLKANRQEDGVRSYGKMVDLVIAWMRAEQDLK